MAGQAGIKVICDGKITNLCDFVYSYFLAEISWLSHHYVMHTSHPRGICLLINNVPKLVVVEEKLKNLFKFLSFDVVIKRRLQRDEVYNLAKKFAKTICLFLTSAIKYLVLMVETRALSILWRSSQHQGVPPSGVNPSYFLFSVLEGHLLRSTMSAQSSQAEALQIRMPCGCLTFLPVRKTAAPKKPTFWLCL